ncbi:hypothetical protein AVB78_23820 [Salmonella enterica subsp. enterica serovar Vitkin]|nr:hypothetical protein [Salmonella enterica subsp. enterica serovar Vitkin]
MEGNEGNLGGAFSFDELVAGNYIANNTVLHRKTVFDKHGGYDMHLVMRRLCDWDLWLRWARHVRFLFIPEVVSVVDANMEGSLGRTVDYDLLTSRFHMAMQRDAKLTPETLGSYVVDDIEHFRPLGYANMDRIWRTHVAPYQARHRELWSIPKRFRSRKLHVLVTKAHYDTNVDITIGNVCPYLEGDYVFSFVPTAQLSRAAVESADIIIFHRTIDAGALELAKHARAAGKSTIYLMDDDLLSMHELDPSFQYLAPGWICPRASGHGITPRLMIPLCV